MYEIWGVGIEERGSEWLSINPLVVNPKYSDPKGKGINTLIKLLIIMIVIGQF